MKKTAFTSFVYSFVFSLLTIFGVSRVCLHVPEEETSDIEISGKNITLFIKNDAVSPLHVVSIPTKKIRLSSIDDIPVKDKTSAISLSNSITSSEEKNVKLVSSEDFTPQDIIPIENDTDIPLSSSDTVKESVEPSASEIVLAATDIPQKEVLPEPQKNEEDIISKKIIYQPDQSSSSQIPNSFEPEEKEAERKDINDNPVELIASNEASETNAKTLSQSSQEHPIETSTSLQATNTQPQLSHVQEDSPQILIPLENSQNKLWAKAEIKTTADIQHNQVAANISNTPVSSLNKHKASEEVANTAIQNKPWKSMKEKYGSSKQDDPWLVAKGKKIPDNQLLLDDKKYKISNEEVEKIFNTAKEASSEEDVNNIQLASKTVKNLLIPIPEDILNDENLTPQLISSPKNKEIKEELEAKGLIKQEEAKEDAVFEPKPQDETTQSGKDESILDSLTSLFSGNKNVMPEIGVNDDNDDDKNSLFSAFTRKQSKLMSKILPTEIRLSFQPNRAEISGQTLKWIKAFAQKTAEEQSTGLEIRIDGTSSPVLQRRRLNLLHNILLNEGAAPEKINTVFTAREPNSFILRTIRINKETINTPAKNNNRYMQW